MPVEAFAPAIAAGFDAISLQFGVPDGSGGVGDIGAAQPGIVAEGSVLGIGFGGQTMVARGELVIPLTTGRFTVQIVPIVIFLIAPEGDRVTSPETCCRKSSGSPALNCERDRTR
jgi:hypothetical protein